MLSYKARPSSGWVSGRKRALSPAPAPQCGHAAVPGADEAGKWDGVWGDPRLSGLASTYP